MSAEWVLGTTHVAVFVTGLLSCRFITKHVRPIRYAITHEESDHHMPTHADDTPHEHVPLRQRFRGKGPTAGATVLFLILGGAMTIAFAIQQTAYQNEAKKRDACVERWGVGMVSTAETRFAATRDLEQAQKARDDALDAIVLTVIAAEKQSRADAEKAFADALSAFATAKAELVTVEQQVAKTRSSNTYPPLQCDDKGPQEGDGQHAP